MSSPGMTFLDMKTELAAFRFNSTQTIYMERWLNLREQMIWSAAEWPFKRLNNVAMSLASGFDAYTLPARFKRAFGVYDADGYPLTWRDPGEFASRNRGQTDTGKPVEYTITNTELFVAPIPDGNYQFTFDFETSISHYNDNDDVVVGPMSEDLDYPYFPVAYFWLVMSGAMATGLKMENDPTWEAVEQDYQQGLDAMKEDLLPPDLVGTMQYGRDTYGLDY